MMNLYIRSLVCFLFIFLGTSFSIYKSYAGGWKSNKGKYLFAPYMSVGIPVSPKDFRNYNTSLGYGLRWGRVQPSLIGLSPSLAFSRFKLETGDNGFLVSYVDVLSIGLAMIFNPVLDDNIAPYYGFGGNYIRTKFESPLTSSVRNYFGLDLILGVDFIIKNLAIVFIENSYRNIFDGDNTGYFSVKIGAGLLYGKKK